MGDDDFDDIDFSELGLPKGEQADRDGPPPAPSFRATVRDGRVMLIGWMPCILDSAAAARPALALREKASVTIADLAVSAEGLDREVAVTFLVHGGGRAAERALERWAEVTGHRRIWFPKRVVTFDECPPLRVASVTCPCCGHAYEESEARFWVAVHARGHFPNFCLFCGGDLPQWATRRLPAR
jgi:hypothetical protein